MTCMGKMMIEVICIAFALISMPILKFTLEEIMSEKKVITSRPAVPRMRAPLNSRPKPAPVVPPSGNGGQAKRSAKKAPRRPDPNLIRKGY